MRKFIAERKDETCDFCGHYVAKKELVSFLILAHKSCLDRSKATIEVEE